MQAAPPRASKPAQTRAVALSALTRWVYLGLALLFLLLGIIGAFLPVMPTTPFILLSAWAAARSSPRLLTWLEKHTAFGPMIHDWRRGGVVRRRAKWITTVMMGASALYLLYGVRPLWVSLSAIACMAATLLWLWRRPESFAVRDGQAED